MITKGLTNVVKEIQKCGRKSVVLTHFTHQLVVCFSWYISKKIVRVYKTLL